MKEHTSYMRYVLSVAGVEGLEVASQPRLRYPATRCIRILLTDRGTSLRSLYATGSARDLTRHAVLEVASNIIFH